MTAEELLQKLIDDRFGGSQAAFARVIDRQPAQVNQYLKGRRKIGAEFRDHVEAQLGLKSYFPRPQRTNLMVNPSVDECIRLLAELGARIRSARDQKGLTVDQVADAAGITWVTLTNLEAGVPSVTLEALAKVLLALGLQEKTIGSEVRSGRIRG